MSYVMGTDLGRLRELLGDTDPANEIFDDEYLTDLVDRFGANGLAAATALTRLLNDHNLLIKKYSRFGPITQNNLAEIRRSILDEIDRLRQSPNAMPETADPEYCPDSNQSDLGFSTDENGWHKVTDIDDYISSL